MTHIVVDRDNVNDEFVVVRKIHKKHGDTVAADELVLEIESSKTTIEIRSPEEGVLSLAWCEGDEVAVGGLLFEVGGASEAMPALRSNNDDDNNSPTTVDTNGEGTRIASNAARDLARQLGVDINAIPSAGWVTSEDVQLRADRSTAAPAGQAPIAAVEAFEEPPRGSNVAHRVERSSLRKRAEVRSLVSANGWGTTSLIAIDVELPGPRLAEPPFLFQNGIADIVIFEAARLLRSYPELNAFYIDERRVGFYDEVNFGISFDRGGELKVLSLERADSISLVSLQARFQELLLLYEADTPIPAHLLNSATITVSDLSRTNINFMFPLLNGNQSLILGITRTGDERFGLHAGFDHRVSEGLQVARFLNELRSRIASHFRERGKMLTLRCSICDCSMKSEVDLGGRGFIKMALADGSPGLLCRNCFEGR